MEIYDFFLFLFPGDVPLLSQLQDFPSLLLFHSLLHIPPSIAMELCCLVGGVLAMLMMIFRTLRCTVMFSMLWILYLSLYKVCHAWKGVRGRREGNWSGGGGGVGRRNVAQLHDKTLGGLF